MDAGGLDGTPGIGRTPRLLDGIAGPVGEVGNLVKLFAVLISTLGVNPGIDKAGPLAELTGGA
jgi:hypothetical protein